MQYLKNFKEINTPLEALANKAKVFATSALSELSSGKLIAISSLLLFAYALIEIGALAETNGNYSPSQTKNPHYREALALIEARDYKSAINSLTLFLKKHPSSVDGYYLRGKAYHELNTLDKASADYIKAIKIDPESYKSHNNLGLIYGRIKKLDLAKKSFTKAIAANPQPKEALNNRGVAKAATGDSSGAISDFTKSIEIDSKYLEPLLNRSFVLEMQGKLRKACNDWKTASLLGSKNAKIWHKSQCK